MAHRLIFSTVVLLSALALGSCQGDLLQPDTNANQRPFDASAPAASNTWLTLADMRSDRFTVATAVMTNGASHSILYAIGGNTNSLAALGKVEAYDATTNTWINRASLPRVLEFTNGAAAIGGKVYVSGGTGGFLGYSAALYMYDPLRNTWSRKRDMPKAGSSGVSGVMNGRLYVLTNCSDDERCPEFVPVAFYRYDPATDQWSTLPSPALPHEGGSAAVIAGKFYVTSGWSISDENPRLDVYDPVANRWTTRAPMPETRLRAAGATLGGKLYVIGGTRLSDDRLTFAPTRTVMAYDPATNQWSLKAPLPSARTGLSGARVVVNGQARLEVVGGIRPGNNLQYIP